jgi:TolB-like protein
MAFKGVFIMKSRFFPVILFFVSIEVFAQNVSLDQALQSSARAIETRLPKGAKTAVLTFTSASQAFSDYVIDEIATAISASRNIQVIDRQNTDAIRKEFNIQFSGDVSDDEVRSVGHQLGAQYVITGSLVDIGNAYRFRVAAINIETAVREGSSSLNININDPQVVFLLTGQRPNQANTTPSRSEIAYKIGDLGPGGGIVFFAQGGHYMEICKELGNGNWNEAIRVARNFRGGGYTDWRLPTRRELNLVIRNIRHIGWHWSADEENTRYAWTVLGGGENRSCLKTDSIYNISAIREFFR